MTEQGKPIAWRALQPGTRVYSNDGERLGKVSHVIADDSKDIFSGLAFQRGMLGHELFAPAPFVERITTDGVHLSLSSDEVETRLRAYGG